MMKQNNLILLDERELMSTSGGFYSSLLKRTVWGALAYYVMENWQEIKSGASSAYKDYYNK